jgi:hypothetical protein
MNTLTALAADRRQGFGKSSAGKFSAGKLPLPFFSVYQRFLNHFLTVFLPFFTVLPVYVAILIRSR